MKHSFSLVYELDTPLAIAVAVYLDAEHYTYLHRKYIDRYEILSTGPRQTVTRQTWRFLGFSVGQINVNEYRPPGEFLNYDHKPYPWWFPSLYHVVQITTHLKYTAIADGEKTLSTLDVELDLPFWLWPLRKFLQRAIERIKIEKDDEDIAMVIRRAKLFGRRNNSMYLREDQFLLHKDDYVRWFGKDSVFHEDAGAASDAEPKDRDEVAAPIRAVHAR